MKETISKLLFLVVVTVRFLTLRLSPQCPLHLHAYISLSYETLICSPLISNTDARKSIRAVVLKLDLRYMKCGLGIRLIKSTPDDYSVQPRLESFLVETSVPPTQWFHLQEREKPCPQKAAQVPDCFFSLYNH